MTPSIFMPIEHVFDLLVPGVHIYKFDDVDNTSQNSEAFDQMTYLGEVTQYLKTVSDSSIQISMLRNPDDTPAEKMMVAFSSPLIGNYYVMSSQLSTTLGADLGSGMTFGQATLLAQRGYAVQREGWNGKGMFVCVMPSLTLAAYNDQEAKARVNDRTAGWIGKDAELHVIPYWAMFTADKKWLPGWLASQSDTLARDWQVFKSKE